MKITIRCMAALLCLLFVCSCSKTGTDKSISIDTSGAQSAAQTEKTYPDIPQEEKYEYTLVFSDEFDGTSLDTTLWKYRTDEKGDGVNEADNVFVRDGRLYIKFDKENDKYTGGGIISKSLFGYGYYETKCTLFAEGGGLHSSFWLMGGSGNGKDLPRENLVFEIDGFEFDSNEPENMSFNLNYKIGKSYGLINKKEVSSISQREIVCGFEWLPDRINWYLDSELVHTVKGEDEPLFYASQAVWLTALANTTMSGKIDDSLLPAYSSFDYFRYYARLQKNENIAGAGGFEYNCNIDFVSKTNMQYPIAFCEDGDEACSFIEDRDDAYAGRCVLVHQSKEKKAYEVRTYQTLSNIPNGRYTFSCMVKGSGNFEGSKISAGIDSAEIDVCEQWSEIKLTSVEVKDNTITLSISSKSPDGSGVLYIDELSFYAEEGAELSPAPQYPGRIREGQRIGEMVFNTKSASFKTSVGWKKSSIIGAEYGSVYKLNATEDDYALWSFSALSGGSYDISVYNIESSGKVQKQKVCVYENGKLKASFNCGACAGWEYLGSVDLSYGGKCEIRIENLPGNRTMRADSVKITPLSSPLYSECVLMHMDKHRAYVLGEMSRLNDVPLPMMMDGELYLPKKWTESALGVALTGELEICKGIEYIKHTALSDAGMDIYKDSSGAIVIYPIGKCSDMSVLGAVSDLF